MADAPIVSQPTPDPAAPGAAILQTAAKNDAGTNIKNRFTYTRDTDEIRVVKDRGFFGVTLPVMYFLPITFKTNTALNIDCLCFIAQRPYQLIQVIERHSVADNNGSAVMVRRVPSGTASGSGIAMLSGNIDMTTTADTNRIFDFGTTPHILQTSASLLQAGDGLFVDFLASGSVPSNLSDPVFSLILRAV